MRVACALSTYRNVISQIRGQVKRVCFGRKMYIGTYMCRISSFIKCSVRATHNIRFIGFDRVLYNMGTHVIRKIQNRKLFQETFLLFARAYISHVCLVWIRMCSNITQGI